jgi:hypothetical protein
MPVNFHICDMVLDKLDQSQSIKMTMMLTRAFWYAAVASASNDARLVSIATGVDI